MLTQNGKDKPETPLDFGLKRNYVKKTLSEIIYEDLKEKILTGEFSADQRLQEDNLAKDYETSRTPIRDALRKLAQENIVEKLPYGGYRIGEIDVDEIEEIFGIRSVLEAYAASLATVNISKDEIQRMEEILDQSQGAIDMEDFDAFVDLDSGFHRLLFQASRSDHLSRMLQNLWDHLIRYRRLSFYAKVTMEVSLRDHQMIIKKMKSGDQKAVERLVKQHVKRALKNQIKGLEKGR